jgi:hypothetical protein
MTLWVLALYVCTSLTNSNTGNWYCESKILGEFKNGKLCMEKSQDIVTRSGADIIRKFQKTEYDRVWMQCRPRMANDPWSMSNNIN